MNLIKEGINSYQTSFDNLPNSLLLDLIIGDTARTKVFAHISDICELNSLSPNVMRDWGLTDKQINLLFAAISFGKRLTAPRVRNQLKLNEAEIVYKFAKMQFTDIAEIEELLLINLDSTLKVKTSEILFRGTRNSSICDVSLIIRKALLANSDGIIIVHNHPSGELMASQEDLHITHLLSEACRIMSIRFLDHLIITSTNYISLKGEI